MSNQTGHSNPQRRGNNTQRSSSSRPQGSGQRRPSGKRKKKRVLNYGRILVWSLPIVFILLVGIIAWRIQVWNKGVAYEMTAEDYNNIKLDTKDNIILMPPSKISEEDYDGITNVLILGNDSYYAGNSDNESIVDMFKKEMPEYVSIEDCTLPGSYLCSYHTNALPPSECPEDYFTLFWISFSLWQGDFSKQHEALQYLDSSKYDVARFEEVVSKLENINMGNLDVVMYCYDGHDYLLGNVPISYNKGTEEPLTEDPETLLGATYTSVYLLNDKNPNTQYVFVSPSFCYATDENGDKVSCAMYDTGNGTIEDTFNAARRLPDYFGVSYIDMYSGVLINEENGKTFLEDDGITPNKKGRDLIADRLVTLLKLRL